MQATTPSELNSETKILEILSAEFARAKLKNRSYSLRAYAQKLKMPPSALSGMLNGKRRVTKKMGQKILLSLGYSLEDTKGIVLKLKDRRNNDDFHDAFDVLPQDQLSIITEWWNLAIYLLVSTHDFQEDAEWISNRLGIDRRTVRTTLERLLRAELLKRDPDGKLSSTDKWIKTPSDVPSFLNRKSHLESMELAAKRLEEVPLELRDYTSISMPIDPKLLPEAKKKITKFRRDLCKFLQNHSTKAEEVYRLNLQFFPLSLREKP